MAELFAERERGPAIGHFAENVMHFARVLRSAGLPVGTDRVELALRALEITGIESREDFRVALMACLVDRPEQVTLFDQAFYIFWRDPDMLGRMTAMMLPRITGPQTFGQKHESRRLSHALFPAQQPMHRATKHRLELDAACTFSEREVLRKADFETMTVEEWSAAKGLLGELELFFEKIKMRRTRRAASPGKLDWRATLASIARGDALAVRWRERRLRPAPLVILADISGSMSKYSRMLLHFAHALSASNVRVTSFVFGTRLTPISRQMAQRDCDVAIAQVVAAVKDWSGGTRIHACLRAFNHDWSRRVLAQNATVLFISDGLEHGDTQSLEFEMKRLAKSCRRLIWLNPLLRYQDFEPRAAGIRAMLPFVDLFLPAHNIESLEALAHILASPPKGARLPPPRGK